MLYNKYQAVSNKALKAMRANVTEYFSREESLVAKEIYSLCYEDDVRLQERHAFLSHFPGVVSEADRVALYYAPLRKTLVVRIDADKKIALFPSDKSSSYLYLCLENTVLSEIPRNESGIKVSLTPSLESLVLRLTDLLEEEKEYISAISDTERLSIRDSFKSFFSKYPKLEKFMLRIPTEAETERKEAEVSEEALSRYTNAFGNDSLGNIPDVLKKAPCFPKFVDFIIELAKFIEASPVLQFRVRALEKYLNDLEEFKFVTASAIQLKISFGTRIGMPSFALQLPAPEYLSLRSYWSDKVELLEVNVSNLEEINKCGLFETEESILYRDYFRKKWLKIKSDFERWVA